ncbi:FkbM family methyltransferase [Flavobacterium sp. '19STA2R22 D10 B1']|uniref:FkbM family methyltransferase n=1 Tax=Flavobacterium aerium TaxID=3037261 RepID=UPI00278BF2FA|nr:FkbM family methyltransferase [Flavobacterium sp. '19STA2R22 D10 B1']
MSFRTKIIQKLIHLNERIFFYPKLRKFYTSHLIKRDVRIIDVGANKGQSIDFFLKIYPDAGIEAFEPNKNLFVYLQNKYKSTRKIELHNFGVSNVEGILEFHENIMDETSSFEELNLNSKYLETKARMLGVSKENIIIDNYDVKVIRLQDFLELRKDTFFDVLKIDVEGHELQTLEGLFSGNANKIMIQFIQFESHNDDMYMNKNQHHRIEDILTQNGYECIAKIKHGFGDFHEIIYENKNIHEA